MIPSEIVSPEPVLQISPASRSAADESLSHFVRRSVLAELQQRGKPGMRIQPVRDIATRFGVAIGTVQHAIRELVDDGVLIARPKLGTVVAPQYNDRLIRSQIAEGTDAPRF